MLKAISISRVTLYQIGVIQLKAFWLSVNCPEISFQQAMHFKLPVSLNSKMKRSITFSRASHSSIKVVKTLPSFFQAFSLLGMFKELSHNNALHRTPHTVALFAKTRKKPASMLRQ